LGRAIVRQPAVFLFDEPLSNLDAKMRVQMRGEIASLRRRLAGTMLYVTHDQVEAMTLGDRIVLMKSGRIQQAAPPLTLYREPATMYVAAFIGSPGMNFFEGTLGVKEGRLVFTAGAEPTGAPALELPLAEASAHALRDFTGREIILGLRPEFIHLAPAGTAPHFLGELEMSEPMGAETHLHLKVGGEAFVVRAPGLLPRPRGEQVPLLAAMDDAVFFRPAPKRDFMTAGEFDRDAWQAASPRVA
jgi:multiple sugar transport system ATP-binding protein